MKCRRIVFIALLIVGAAALAPAQEPGDLRLNLTVTWDLGLRVGLDYRVTDRIGLQADVGSTLFSLEGACVLTGDLFAVYDVLPPDESFRLRALVGVPDWRIVFAGPATAEIAFGGSIETGYEFAGPWGVFLRAGAGVPFFAEAGTFAHDSTDFPLGLWPDLSAGAKLSL